MQSTEPPDPPIRIPLFTGDGFAEDLSIVGLWSASCAVALSVIPLLLTGHWILGPLALLVGAFFAGAWWHFPAHAWAQRPADLWISREGLRVVGGASDGLHLAWADIDAARCALVRDPGIFLRRLVVVLRDGREIVLAQGDELSSFAAVLDVLRAVAGLEPLPDGYVADFDPNEPPPTERKTRRARSRRTKSRRDEPRPDAPAPTPDDDAPEVLACPGCGAPVVPADEPAVTCRHCGAACPLPELLRLRLREVSRATVLAARNHRRLRRLLAQPSSGWAQALVLALAGLPALLWLCALLGFSALLWRDSLDLASFGGLVVPPVLLGIALPIAAGLYTCRRRAVRLLTLDFAAAPPTRAGDPPRCRVCGAPLAIAGDALVAGCAYCRATNIVAVTAPRTPVRQERQAATLEDAIGMFQAEMLFRVIAFIVFGVPGLVLSWFAAGLLLR